MGDDFRSTVLQRPPTGDDERTERDRDRERDRERDRDSDRDRYRRDVMDASSGSPHQQHRHAGFSLRSPTRSHPPPPPQHHQHHQPPPDYHRHPPPYSSPSSNAGAGASHPHPHSPPRPLHNNSYMPSSAAAPSGGPVAPTLPPVGMAPSSPSAGASNSHHHAPPVSPLHPPAGYYPPAARDSKPAGSFYDPLTDTTTTTKERRVSDSWRNTPQPPAAATTPNSKVSKRQIHSVPTDVRVLCPPLPLKLKDIRPESPLTATPNFFSALAQPTTINCHHQPFPLPATMQTNAANRRPRMLT